MTRETPTTILAELGHAIASVYTLAAQVLEPDWAQQSPDDRAEAVDGPVEQLRGLAPRLEQLQRQAGAMTLQQALFLARAQVHTSNGTIGIALAIARAGAVLNHWLSTLAGLHSRQSESGPLTIGELFDRAQRMSQDPRQSLALETQSQERAIDTSARHLIATSIQLSDQALGLLWLHGNLHGQDSSDLSQTAARLLSQASGVVLCGAGLLSSSPLEVAETEPDEDAECDAA